MHLCGPVPKRHHPPPIRALIPNHNTALHFVDFYFNIISCLPSLAKPSCFNISFLMVLDILLRVIPPSKVVSISVLWKLCIKGSEIPPENPQALSSLTVGQPWAPADLSRTHVKVFETLSVGITGPTGPVFLAEAGEVSPIYMPRMKNTAKPCLVSTPLLGSCIPTHSPSSSSPLLSFLLLVSWSFRAILLLLSSPSYPAHWYWLIYFRLIFVVLPHSNPLV